MFGAREMSTEKGSLVGHQRLVVPSSNAVEDTLAGFQYPTSDEGGDCGEKVT